MARLSVPTPSSPRRTPERAGLARPPALIAWGVWIVALALAVPGFLEAPLGSLSDAVSVVGGCPDSVELR